jgi:hypothetical protein
MAQQSSVHESQDPHFLINNTKHNAEEITDYYTMIFSSVLYLLLLACSDIVLKFNAGGFGSAML